MKIKEAKLRDAIIKQFGTQGNFAKKAGLNDGQVSRGIKMQTVQFMQACRRAGLDVDLLDEEELTKASNLSYRLKIADSRIKELEDIVDKQKNLIASYELILKSKLIENK